MKSTDFIVTFFYLGRIKYAPGTFGSLGALVLAYILIQFAQINQINFHFMNLNELESYVLSIFLITFLSAIIIFIVGWYFTKLYLKETQAIDPKEVVIDEVAGQLLTISLSFFSFIISMQSTLSRYINNDFLYLLFVYLLPFILFRFFDILKPWPINWLDKNVDGALGVMIDDIAAALFASLMQYAFIFIIIDIVG